MSSFADLFPPQERIRKGIISKCNNIFLFIIHNGGLVIVVIGNILSLKLQFFRVFFDSGAVAFFGHFVLIKLIVVIIADGLGEELSC